MMKKTFVCMAALTMLFSTFAMGYSITHIDQAVDTQNANFVGALSADGRFVGITKVYVRPSDQAVFQAAAVYDTQTNTYGTFRLNSGHGNTRGVANLNGVPLGIVREGNGSATWKMGTYEALNETSGYMDGSAVSRPGGQNAMAMDANGNGWMVGGMLSGNNARAWRITGGVVNATAAYNTQKYGNNEVLNGVSLGGMAVGTYRDANSQDRSFLTRVDPANPGNRSQNFGQISTSNRSQGNAVSSNGVWAAGYVYVDDANTLNGWRLEINPNFPAGNPDPTLSDGIYTRLYPVGHDPLVAQQSNVFGLAADGTAVGFSYDPNLAANMRYRATLWAPGSSQGVLAWDILTSLGVDLSGWQSLERIISISDDGLTIAGRGYLSNGQLGAFVATIPEPATLSLLALGGLALLRRRR